MQSTTLDLSADVIDVRDIIARVEEIKHEEWAGRATETLYVERLDLQNILQDLKGYGGDEQYEGDWYPVTLIRESYFTEYTRELLADCDILPPKIPDYIEIDWHATARNIQVDYSSVEIDGATYWYR